MAIPNFQARDLAIRDTEDLARAAAFDLNQSILPELLKAQRGAGASGDALAGVQAQLAADSLAATVAKQRAGNIVAYENIETGRRQQQETVRNNAAREQIANADLELRDTISQRQDFQAQQGRDLQDLLNQRDNDTQLSINELLAASREAIQAMDDQNNITVANINGEYNLLGIEQSGSDALRIQQLKYDLGIRGQDIAQSQFNYNAQSDYIDNINQSNAALYNSNAVVRR